MNYDKKKKIDEMTYEQMLAKWRFVTAADPMFLGEIGEYFAEAMADKKKKIGDAAAVAVSKALG